MTLILICEIIKIIVFTIKDIKQKIILNIFNISGIVFLLINKFIYK